MTDSEKQLGSELETRKHIQEVQKNLAHVVKFLLTRAENHDKSKLSEPELSAFASTYGELGKCEYYSPEYKALLEKIRPAIQHHYKMNTHHMEHYQEGVTGMDLLDLIEMVCDWIAAVKRNKNGNILKSIDINCEKHKVNEQLKLILKNTVVRYF
jgi:hypothetical protein